MCSSQIYFGGKCRKEKKVLLFHFFFFFFFCTFKFLFSDLYFTELSTKPIFQLNSIFIYNLCSIVDWCSSLGIWGLGFGPRRSKVGRQACYFPCKKHPATETSIRRPLCQQWLWRIFILISIFIYCTYFSAFKTKWTISVYHWYIGVPKNKLVKHLKVLVSDS